MNRIYLDYSATTPLDPKAGLAMREFEQKFFGNPSSAHREGQDARARIDFARSGVARFISARPQEIIFTSGATESNNLAIQGVVNYYSNQLKSRPHIVTTTLEHQSVYNTVKNLQDRGVIEATFVRPSKDGLIAVEDVLNAIRPNTVLVSVIFVSNEIGSVLPVREIGEKLKSLRHHPSTITPVFHIDAVQAAKFYNCNVQKLNCDLLTLSAHKLYGPKGIGALYVKSGLKMENLSLGGSQEYGRRPGTQNTGGIIGFDKAVQLLGALEDRQALGRKLAKLRDKFISELLKIKNAELNGPMGDDRSPDNVSLTFFGIDQDAFMTAVDLAGIAASTGSACVSGSSEPSHVIKSLRKVSQRRAATLRLTLGKNTKTSEADYTIKTLSNIIKKLRHEK